MDPSCLQFDDVANICFLEKIFANIITSLAALVLMVFFIMLVFGGFRYLTSAGNAKAAEAAKGTITSAFLGILAIVGAYVVLRILSGFTGLTLTTFTLPSPNP